MFVVGAKSVIVLIFHFLGDIPWPDTKCPKYSILPRKICIMTFLVSCWPLYIFQKLILDVLSVLPQFGCKLRGHPFRIPKTHPILKNNLNMRFRQTLGALCMPKATCFHWNFSYGHINAVFALESGCMKIWWYLEWMSSMEKYFASFNVDQMWSNLVVSISTRLPLDFAWVVCTLGIC